MAGSSLFSQRDHILHFTLKLHGAFCHPGRFYPAGRQRTESRHFEFIHRRRIVDAAKRHLPHNSVAHDVDDTLARRQNIMQRVFGRVIHLAPIRRKDANGRIRAKHIEKTVRSEIGHPLSIHGAHKSNGPRCYSTYKVLVQLHSRDGSRIYGKHAADDFAAKIRCTGHSACNIYHLKS